jgi:type IV pilus assembly protein PilF
MRLRDALVPALCVALLAVGGCGGGSYVRTSLGRDHHIEPAVNRISEKKDKARDEAAIEQRALVEVARNLAEGDFPAAKRSASAILKRHPGSVDAHTYLAIALDETGDAAGAAAHYLRATELAPTNGGVLGNYGIWLCEQGRAVESLSWFDRALALPSYKDSSLIVANAGVCAGKAGQPQRAEQALRRAVELDPQNSLALGALAEREFRAGDAFEARAFSERRLAVAPADAKALLLASQIEQKLGDSSAAERYVSRLKTEFPDAPEARNSAIGDGGRQ